MVGLFLDTGRVSNTGMGIAPLSWSEIAAFNHCNGLSLSNWEMGRLMDMSREFCKWNSIGGQQSDMADDVPYVDRSISAGNYLIKQREQSVKEQNDNALL